ncbi:MAG: hypothetical protein AB7I41_18590 [Candidatus Sericytochromatia bacterium]
MSETPAYFLLAQLFTLMTASLRLALGFALLSALALAWGLCFNKNQQALQGLARYFNGWLGLTALAGGCFAGAEFLLLSYPNFFVQRGVAFAFGLLLLWGVQKSVLLKSGQVWQGLALGLHLAGLVLACLMPAFSRSNETAITVLFALPVALVISYFCLWLSPKRAPSRRIRTIYHGLWGGLSAAALSVYLFWLYPRLAGLPPEGEFYPFLKLYDWFLMLFMLLYLGNLYIDYWLRTGKNREKPALVLAWNYGVLIAGLICLWFNASIFDTLAL